MNAQDELIATARRCLWWQHAEESLRNPLQFLCHVMVYGLWEDALVIRRRFSRGQLRAALQQAPPGLFDIRSWHYWHRTLGLEPPALPVRRIPGAKPEPPASKLDFHLGPARSPHL